MNVTIIGAGNMGRGIGRRFLAGGHSITLVDIDGQAAEQAAADLKMAAGNDAPISTGTLEAVELGDVVVLALWYGANVETVRQLGKKLEGRIVVDVANPLNSTFDGLATAPESSSAEDVASAVVAGASVVKAFNTTFAGTLMVGQVDGKPLDVFIAGDDADAKVQVARLIADGGLRPIDVGPLSRARQLEGIGLLHISLQQTLGSNWMSAVKIIN
jgi:8-hydroxy-5-deazaflavin:NADPH oxidoreductase